MRLHYADYCLIRTGCEGLAGSIARLYDEMKDLNFPHRDERINSLLYYLQMILRGADKIEEEKPEQPQRITVYSKFEDLVEALKNASSFQPPAPRQ